MSNYITPVLRVRNNQGEWDISQMVQSITWWGDIDTVCRMLSFEMIVSATDPKLPYVYLPLSGGVSLTLDGKTVFVGNVVEKTKSTDSGTMSVDCCDKGRYLKASQATRKYNGETPETITRQLCSTYGVGVKTLANTSGFAVRRKFSATPIYQIIDTAYTLAGRQNKKKYLLRFDGPDLEVVERGVTPQSIILKPGSNITAASYTESVENMVNRVLIMDDEGNQISSVSDDAAVKKHGLLAHVITQGEGDDANAEAREILEDNGVERRVTIDCLGHPKLLTGNTVYLHEPYTGQIGTFWIDSDKHKWSRGVYTCQVTLNRKNTMREGDSGSEVDE